MPHHPESRSLCRYLIETAIEFVSAIEEVLWTDWKPGDDHVDGMGELRLGFWILGLQLANADGSFSYELPAGKWIVALSRDNWYEVWVPSDLSVELEVIRNLGDQIRSRNQA